VHSKKQQIISEYLSGKETFKVLSAKYDVNLRTIQSWVRSFRKSTPSPSEALSKNKEDVKSLKKALEQERLKNELLEEMLRLSEEQTGIDFRKKFGTKQS